MTYASNTPAETTHYVTRITIERVDHRRVETRNGIAGAKTEEAKRTVTELSTFTLKADSLTGLVEKAGKHLDLVEDIDATDAVRPKGTRGDV
jgi:hypothetical protein